MFFRFLKFIMPYLTFRVYFRRIFYSNLKKVPLEKPLIFVGNHQNSFLDGMLVGSYLPQPINFTMRADMFKKPFARFCLRELNVSPVYRLEEGLENVHKNFESFETIYRTLQKNGNYIMFSEGICVQEKRLQKLRKGTARLAFGADEQYGIDVHIVPVGINYTYPASFRKEVIINFADSFSIRELKDIYAINPAKAFLAFNEKCAESLKKEVIIVEKPEDDWLAEELLKIERNNFRMPFFRWKFDTDERLRIEQRVVTRINHLSKNYPATAELLKSKVKDYTSMLADNKLADKNFARKPDYGFLRWFGFIGGFPLFLAGIITNLIPFIVPKFICDRLIKDKRFYSSVYTSTGTVLYLIYFPVLLVLAFIFTGWVGFLATFTVPILGYLVLY